VSGLGLFTLASFGDVADGAGNSTRTVYYPVIKEEFEIKEITVILGLLAAGGSLLFFLYALHFSHRTIPVMEELMDANSITPGDYTVRRIIRCDDSRGWGIDGC
jgi:hypothetical protein